jgi:hypothetical protein
MSRILPVLLLMMGCVEPSEDDAIAGVCPSTGTTELIVLSQIVFPREVDGVTSGFNLDDDVSFAGGSTGCGIEDQLGPNGEEGIDNAFARLRPALDATEAEALDLIVMEAINSGGLLMMAELENVDDLYNDDCVNMSVTGAVGVPMVGADGVLLPAQTFERNAESEVSSVEGLEIVDGSVLGGPVNLSMPFEFLDAQVSFNLTGGLMQITRDERGGISGMVGGGVNISELSALAHGTGIDETVEIILDSLLGLNADLAPDDTGVCQEISITLEFDAVEAFWFEE